MKRNQTLITKLDGSVAMCFSHCFLDSSIKFLKLPQRINTLHLSKAKLNSKHRVFKWV